MIREQDFVANNVHIRPAFEPFPLSEAIDDLNARNSLVPRTAVFYYDDHSMNSEEVFVGWLDQPEDLRRALGNILFTAVESTNQPFSPTLSFREMTQEEVDELPSV